MEILQLLGTALGLGALAGLNLYLTVFASGLAIQQGWIDLAPQYHQLLVLGNPAIVLISGALFLIEFFADKIPWVDSLWDIVHTVIRPLGGAFLATRALGATDPTFEVVIALLGAASSLGTHSLKAGTRLIVNASPEPFSNIALSVTEDATVLGGLALIHLHPVIALIAVVAGFAFLLVFGPRIARAIFTRLWLMWKKFASGPDDPKADTAELSKLLPSSASTLLRMTEAGTKPVEWAIPCLCGGSKRIRANVSGHLIAVEGEPGRLYFVSKGRLSKATEIIDLAGCKATHESRFLSENLVIHAPEHHRPAKRTFIFPRPSRNLVIRLAETIDLRVASTQSDSAA